MFCSDIEMLPEHKGNIMLANVTTTKTVALGWEITRSIKEYYENFNNCL